MLNFEGSSALAMQVEIHKAYDLRRFGNASFLCAYFQVGKLPVVLAEHEIDVPVQRWEIRASGLWADMICEQPFNHWSYGLEAFGLAIDEPNELLGRGYGDRVPLGWELDFESSQDRVESLPDQEGYRQVGLGDGIVLLADHSVPLHGPAVRHHWWGRRDLMHFQQLDDQVDDRAGDQIKGQVDSGQPPGGVDTCEVALPMPGAVWRLAHEPGRLTSSTEPAAVS